MKKKDYFPGMRRVSDQQKERLIKEIIVRRYPEDLLPPERTPPRVIPLDKINATARMLPTL